jgi:xanthine dehydrogenase accessory factor
VLIRGCGDVGSAVAHLLVRTGHEVVIHDVALPAAPRRGMAFADAVFDGAATLDGVGARRAVNLIEIGELLARRTVVVYVGPFAPLAEALAPYVLVDARMRKRAVPESQRGLARVTIGLGPNFHAGVTCDAAVETSWDGLGTVIYDGATRPLAGEPRELGGHARARYVYAPADGVFRTQAKIGDPVTAGQPVAMIDGVVLSAPVSGVLRGLTHDGVPVTSRTKVIEVDPRGHAAEVAGIGQRPRQIADGVMAALRTLGQ